MEEVKLKVELNFNPNKKHIADIKNWLIEERNKTNKGFYCNWKLILKGFAEKSVCVITQNDYAIGFVYYSIWECEAVINIATIKPMERKKRVAKELINGTLEYFKQKGVLVTRLYCQPESSESFWRKIGFENFPKLKYYNNQIWLFKPLIEVLQSTEKAETDTRISLWDCQNYQANGVTPKWVWDLKFNADNETLVKPIIFPAHYD